MNGNKIKIKGFFVKLGFDGQPINDELSIKIRNHAKRLNMPIVEIKQKSMYAEHAIDTKDNKLAIHDDNKRFLLAGYDNNFMYFDNKGFNFFMTQAELDDLLLKNKQYFSADQIIKIKQDYQLADQKYHKMKFNFNKKGDLSGIIKNKLADSPIGKIYFNLN